MSPAWLLAAAAALPSPPAQGAALLDEVWAVVVENFLDPDLAGIDAAAVHARWRERAAAARSRAGVSEAIDGLLGELHTSHTARYTPEQVEYYQLLDVFARGPLGEQIRGLFPGGEVAYDGIGVFTREVEGRRHVSGVLAGSPGAAAGLETGDALVAADGAPFHPIHSFEGRAGRPVRLTLQSTPDAASRVERVVVPERIRPRERFLRAMEEGARVVVRSGVPVAYVRVWSYAGRAYHERLVELLGRPPLSEARALVLDVRGGWGGAAPEYLNLFNPRVPVLEMLPREGDPTTWDSQWRRPVVLLVDEGSRSGKELLAWGFHRYRIGPVVGGRTAGAVTAGRPFLLSDGSVLYLAVAAVRVDGRSLEGVGVRPDVPVPFDLPWSRGADPRLERALDVAAGLAIG